MQKILCSLLSSAGSGNKRDILSSRAEQYFIMTGAKKFGEMLGKCWKNVGKMLEKCWGGEEKGRKDF
jgi:hypothetical protein